MKKNVAGQKLKVFAKSISTGEPAIDLDTSNFVGRISKNWGASVALNDAEPTQAADKGGYYFYDLTQEETNADNLDFFISYSGDSDIFVEPCLPFVPSPFPIMVNPTSGNAGEEPPGTRLFAKTKETKVQTVTVYVLDENGDETEDEFDFTGLTLRVCIERKNGDDLQVIENAGITVNGGTVQFTTLPATHPEKLSGRWSLRNAANDAVILDGPYDVIPSAYADS